ncbi:COQ7 protein [Epithele typhae]|uniref:COQ7 protein n=1 Tax=Epithele typhae TaxID=378194 RepID=UPI002008B6EF|nr:COQ7 protein [Epithele typhae]KAH9923994.1 COQ7 protein [Epithele typhae]
MSPGRFGDSQRKYLRHDWISNNREKESPLRGVVSTLGERATAHIYLDPARSEEPSVTTTPNALPAHLRHEMESALRVDQAGELAANWIYKGQYAVLGRDPTTGPLIQDMWDQEKKHLAVMNKLQHQHHVRPTLLWELARIGGYGLGAATALMGKEAAMACTEAVETVIGEHYNESCLIVEEIIKEFRDDELEHLDIAVQNDAQKAPAHALLSTIVGAGCKVAIELCKRF